MLYPKPSYNKVCYDGTVLYLLIGLGLVQHFIGLKGALFAGLSSSENVDYFISLFKHWIYTYL